MLYREIVAVCSDIRTKHTNVVCVGRTWNYCCNIRTLRPFKYGNRRYHHMFRRSAWRYTSPWRSTPSLRAKMAVQDCL